MGCISDGFFQEDLNSLSLLKLEVFGCGIDLGLDIFDRTLFDYRESGVKLGWEPGRVGKGGYEEAQIGLGIEATDSLGDGFEFIDRFVGAVCLIFKGA